MFHLHDCKVEKINTKISHQSEEVLYNKVKKASDEMGFNTIFKQMESKLIFHSNAFEMKVEKNSFHLFLVPVIIHNKKYRFIVDTGAQISGIMDHHIKNIPHQKNDIKFGIKSASGSQKQMSSITLKRLFFGSLEVTNHNMVVLSSDDFKIPLLNKKITDFDGILGWDILSQIDFELDDVSNRLVMLDHKEDYSYRNLVNAHFPVVIAYDKNEKPTIFGIDSGAEVSWLSKEYSEKANLTIEKESKGMNIGVHGMEAMSLQIIKEIDLRVHEAKIHLKNIRTGDTKVFMNLALDGIFGNEIFHNHRIQFLNSKGIVRIL